MIVTVTLSPGALGGLTPALIELGITVRERALLHFVPPDSWAPLDEALAHIGRYEAIVVSSPRTARALRERWETAGHRAAELPEIWAAGPSTAARLSGLAPVHSPENGGGAVILADLMLAAQVQGPILYLCGVERRDELPERLGSAGVVVQEVVCYRAELAPPERIKEALGETDQILMASHRLIALAAGLRLTGPRPGLVCLGEATARTARAVGWEPTAVARAPTVEGVVGATAPLRCRAPKGRAR